MRRIFLFIVLSLLSVSIFAFAQDDQDSVEINVIDSFVTPETPHNFMLYFFTSEPCKSSVKIADKYTYEVAKKPEIDHKIKIDITNLNFTTKTVPFIITVVDSLGHEYKSQKYDFDLPKEIKLKSDSNFLLFCLFGGTIFALPSPEFVWDGQNNYFGLTKEIPVISFRGSGFSYPTDYISLEYTHVFNSNVQNYLRLGYKHLMDFPFVEYVAPGINAFTNFKGFNGISPEISIGWFKIFNTFTVYSRYRYNFKPNDSSFNFNEISIGLYSSFFSVYL